MAKLFVKGTINLEDWIFIDLYHKIGAVKEGTAYINRVQKYSYCYYWVYLCNHSLSVWKSVAKYSCYAGSVGFDILFL